MASSSTALSLYDTTIPMMIKSLQNLSHVLTKGQEHLKAKSLPESTLIEAKLADDMKPLPFQIQSACNSAKFTAVRIGGVTLPSFADDEKTFEELHNRINSTIEMLEKDVKRDAFNGAETKEVDFMSMKFTGLSYAIGYAIPNFMFHTSTAYLILRNNGVEVGKRDYLMGAGNK